MFSGAGAAGIACAKLYMDLGVRAENIVMCDSKGVIHSERREGMNVYKEEFARGDEAPHPQRGARGRRRVRRALPGGRA